MGPDQIRYEFECPDCHQRLTVDPPVQEVLLVTGCIYCDEDSSWANSE